MHDERYKTLFAFPRSVEDLVRGFAAREQADALDFSTLRKVPAEYISDTGLIRRGRCAFTTAVTCCSCFSSSLAKNPARCCGSSEAVADDRDPSEPNPQIPDHANDPEFAAFLRGEGSGVAVPVLALPDALAHSLGTTARAALLSRETANKQLKHNLSPADYARLQQIIDRGTTLRSRDHHLEFYSKTTSHGMRS